MGYELSIRTSFAAAHQIKGYEGPCEELHGHNWKIEIFIQAEKLDDIGIAIDFKVIKNKADELLNMLDHKNLNKVLDFLNPTSENIARWLYNKLKDSLKSYNVKVSKVSVWETDSYCATYGETL